MFGGRSWRRPTTISHFDMINRLKSLFELPGGVGEGHHYYYSYLYLDAICFGGGGIGVIAMTTRPETNTNTQTSGNTYAHTLNDTHRA